MTQRVQLSAPEIRAFLRGTKKERRQPLRSTESMVSPGQEWFILEEWGARGDDIVYAAHLSTEGRAHLEGIGYKFRSAVTLQNGDVRLILEVDSVRAERLHDITDEGAIAEGVRSRAEFPEFWDSLFAAGGSSWQTNPSVLVVRFRAHSIARIGALHAH